MKIFEKYANTVYNPNFIHTKGQKTFIVKIASIILLLLLPISQYFSLLMYLFNLYYDNYVPTIHNYYFVAKRTYAYSINDFRFSFINDKL